MTITGGSLNVDPIPLPVGPVIHRPVERRNTSPFQRQAWRPTDPERFAAEQNAAEKLANLDKRRGAKSKGRPGREKTGGSVREWDLDDAVRRYDAGETIKEISASIGRDYRTVGAAIAARTTMRNRGDYVRPTFDLDAMLADAPAMTQKELAAKYGIDPRTVRKWLAKRGSSSRDGRGRKAAEQ